MDIQPNERNCENSRARGVASSALLEPKPRKRGGALPLAILATAAIGIDGFGGLWRSRTSAQKVRNDPRREKTPDDLAAIAAASERRARREAARKNRANQTEGSNVAISQPEDKA